MSGAGGAAAALGDVSGLFQSAQKYEELDVIGTGAYGTVYKARDLQNGGQVVALKKVRLALTEDGVPLSALREIALLRQLEAHRHPNIVRLLEVCHGGGAAGAGAGAGAGREPQLVLYLVFEHVEQDLDSYLQRAPPGPLPQDLVRSMAHDILSGVDFLHAHRVVHRDLKPHNLLVTAQARVKIADFGLAKTYDAEMRLTSVVVTLWYRPPEVLLGAAYNTAVDVWSSGAVLAQLWARAPLLAGAGDAQQLRAILRLLGRPPRAAWPPRALLDWASFPPYPPRPLADALPAACPPLAVDLIQRMLVFEPSARLTALDCLRHPYFTSEPLPH